MNENETVDEKKKKGKINSKLIPLLFHDNSERGKHEEGVIMK